jgi:hypothetical protein
MQLPQSFRFTAQVHQILGSQDRHHRGLIKVLTSPRWPRQDTSQVRQACTTTAEPDKGWEWAFSRKFSQADLYCITPDRCKEGRNPLHVIPVRTPGNLS